MIMYRQEKAVVSQCESKGMLKMSHPCPYVNKFCYRSSVELFLHRGKTEWLSRMKDSFYKVSSHPLEMPQIEAWKDEYDVLAGALAALPSEYRKLQIVFEYTMPKSLKLKPDDPTVRADAILLSSDTVAILEFKQHNKYVPIFLNQVLKYRRRIQERHLKSKGMNKRAILILTKANDPTSFYQKKVWICSPDQLTDVLIAHVGSVKMSSDDIKQWIDSDWKVMS